VLVAGGRKEGLFTSRIGKDVPRAPQSSAKEIAQYLSRSDPVLAQLIRSWGPTDLPSRGEGFPILAQSILFQQISGAAGAAILRRLRKTHGGPTFPPPEWFLSVSTPALRDAGVSPQKMRYLRDLAARVVDGRLELRRLSQQPDPQVIEELTAVLGIGVWTAQMYLIFSLHRPDVIPSGDLGIRKAVGKAWGYRTLPAESTVERHARRWTPYRSHAAYYLWRSLDSAPG
jgi:DNA-3-methyladenine glycosylase II